MGLPVVTVVNGGLPIVETTAGTPVTEATNGYGMAVTKVVGKPGLPVTFETIGVGGGELVWRPTYTKTMTSNSANWNGYNIRVYIPPASLAFSGTKVRVRVLSSLADPMVIDAAEIGHAASSGDLYDFDGGQIPLTFNGGSASVTVTANTTKMSDEKTFSFDKTKGFIVAAHFTGLSGTRSDAVGVSQGYYKSAANEVSVSNVTGYVVSASTYLVDLIEVM